MTAPATWGQVHIGDTVRGADQRAWTVIGRDAEREWVSEGREAAFELELAGDEPRTVQAWRMLGEPAPLVARADHSDMARAVQALIDNDIRFTIIEEKRVTTVEPEAATAPIKRDRWGRYMLPHPETGKEQAWTRATTIARVLADEYNLSLWAQRMVAKGMAIRPDLVAGAAAADIEADKGTLNSIAEQAKEQAGSKSGANLGTALHAFTERLDRGETLKSLSAPAPLNKDISAYRKLISAAGLQIVPEFIERIVVVPELGVAGTIDRLAGNRVFDLKTAKSVDYSWMEIAIQLAIYAHASHAWNPATGAYDPMPAVDRAVGLVLHLPVGKASPQLYYVNLTEGWRLAQIASDVKAARSKAKDLAREFSVEAPDTVMKLITKAETQQALAELWATYHPRGLWTSEVNAYAQARLRHITAGVTVSATAT